MVRFILVTLHRQKMLNIYEYYAKDFLLNGSVRISEKIVEIRAIYLDTQRSRRAVHSAGST